MANPNYLNLALISQARPRKLQEDMDPREKIEALAMLPNGQRDQTAYKALIQAYNQFEWPQGDLFLDMVDTLGVSSQTLSRLYTRVFPGDIDSFNTLILEYSQRVLFGQTWEQVAGDLAALSMMDTQIVH